MSAQSRRERIRRQVRVGHGDDDDDDQPRLTQARAEQFMMLLGELLSSAAERSKFRQALDLELGLITDRERRVIELRFGLTGNEPMTFQEIADIFGITGERVRQIQVTVLKRLSHPKHVARLHESLK